MKVTELIQPVLTLKELELLRGASKLHEDPELHLHPERQRLIFRLMKMGLLRQLRTDSLTKYELTEKGRFVLKS